MIVSCLAAYSMYPISIPTSSLPDQERPMHEAMNMRGALTLQLIDTEGRIISEQHYKNRIVTSGRRLVAEMFGGPSGNTEPTKVTEMAVGDGSTPTTDADTALQSERLRKPIGSVEYAEVDEGTGANATRRVRVRLQTEL